MLGDEGLEQRIAISLAWLRGTSGKKKTPHLTYFDAGSEEDVEGRMATAQLLMDDNAPRHIRQLLAAALVPDFELVPTQGYPIHPTGALSTVMTEGPLPRRLDFQHRGQGKRRRGTTKVTDPYKFGHIISAIAQMRESGMKKTAAFQQVAIEESVSETTVRTYWKLWANALNIEWDSFDQ